MKIHVLGNISIGLAISATLAAHSSIKCEVVTVDSIDDIDNPDDVDVLICDDFLDNRVSLFCGHPLDNIGVNVFTEPVVVPCRDDSWRGGSIGKGGKVKYNRK